METKPKVVVVGAGFGGLAVVQGLKKANVDITLIDKRNHHLFQPLLYQVATAGLSPSDIAWPIRSILAKQENARVVLGNVEDIDLVEKKVLTEARSYKYDHLVIATGSRHSYFGKDEWEESAPGLKRVIDATEIRKRILLAFERAEIAESEEARRRNLTFFIIGGGPTGVEMAGAIAELANHALTRDFRSIDPTSARIVLAHGMDRLLPSFPAELSAYAKNALEKLGVEVMLNKLVSVNGRDGVSIGDDDIPCATVVWAAGVNVPKVAQWLQVETDSTGRIPVNDYLNVTGHPDIYVIGDAAEVKWQEGSIPGIAPAAKQAGKYVSKSILSKLKGNPVTGTFEYKHKGDLATIGRNSAVVDFGRFRFKGSLAWWLWGVAHIYFLIGVRAPLLVATQWFWSYITFGKGARLITGVMPLYEIKESDKESSKESKKAE